MPPVPAAPAPAIDQQGRLGRQDGAQTIERLTDTINDSPQQTHADRDTMFIADGGNLGAGDHPLELLTGHQKQFVAGKTDHFGFQITIQGVDTAEGANGCPATDGLQGQPDHPGELARHRRYGGLLANPVAFKPIKKGCRHVASDDECLMMPSAGRCTTGSNRAMAQLALSRRKLRSS